MLLPLADEYDGSICVTVAMHPVAITAVATCSPALAVAVVTRLL